MSQEAVIYNLTASRIAKTKLNAKEDQDFSYLPDEGVVPFEGTFDFGGDLEGAIERFGDEVVYNKAKMAIGLDLGSRVRDLLEAGKTQEEVQEVVNTWIPGVTTRTKKSPKEKAKALLAGMSPEDIQALLADMQSEAE